MKESVSTFLIFAMLIQGIIPLFAQQPGHDKTKIAIIDFRNTSGKSDLNNLQTAIPEVLITRLAESGKLNIVERARLEDAIKEIQLGMAGVVDQSAAVEIGKAVGANAILVGSYLEIGGLIQLNARLIDVQTSKVLIAKIVKGRVGTEIFDLMDELAVAIEEKLVGKKPAPKKEPAQQKPAITKIPVDHPVTHHKKGGSKAGLWILGIALVGGGVAAAVLLGGGSDSEGEISSSTVTIAITVP